jgi:hypothetical protein
MTMQVGMLGTDGVLLGGDTRLVRKPLSGIEGPWKGYDGPKIRISDSRRVAVSCAHDMQTANDVADAIFSKMTRGDELGTERQIKEIAIAAAQGRDIECLIAFSDPLPCLYLFQYVNAGLDIECQRIITCVPSGDTRNPAVFWGMRYYKMLPLDQLKNLAACLVVAAGALNNGLIGGFEIVFCTKDGCHRLSDDSAHDLKSSAKDKIKRIGEFILGNTAGL